MMNHGFKRPQKSHGLVAANSSFDMRVIPGRMVPCSTGLIVVAA